MDLFFTFLFQITFFTPEQSGRVIYRLFVMSDSYLGLDQQYDIHLDVEEGFAEVTLLTFMLF